MCPSCWVLCGKAGLLQVLVLLLPGPDLLVVAQPNSGSLLEIMVLSEGPGGKGGSLLGEKVSLELTSQSAVDPVLS